MEKLNPFQEQELEDMLFGKLPQEWIDAIFEIMKRDQSSEPFFLPLRTCFRKKHCNEHYLEENENLSTVSIPSGFILPIKYGGRLF